ncbi:hypothetical protein LTR70_008525 [Exophiala xenobiotica]|uniref:Uncharacterized protein n=1 Tax=Lithohypha guttulata TaxID=1690604 RepID=A0ABR0K0Z7_9EURO|nr:hypothetical protein LTR24_008123 [Lithohypha guttulata]KAK5311877.1 hypothetical protein LTR70_008525 [Exophiala xenobiotica]
MSPTSAIDCGATSLSQSPPIVPFFSIQEMFDQARAYQPEFYDPYDEAEDRLLRAITVIANKHETSWCTPELLGSFFKNIAEALSSPPATKHVILNVHSSPTPPSQQLYDLMIREVVDRLKLARVALFADDPQLAMSILLNRMCTGEDVEYFGDLDAPIDDIMEVCDTAQPQERLILIDSAYYRARFVINPAELADLVHQAYVDMSERPAGNLQQIPQGVFAGLSNHEMRQKHLKGYMATVAQAIEVFSEEGHPPEHQLMAWTEIRTKWEMRAENHEYQNSLLPPPASPDTVLFYRQADPLEVIEQIKLQQKYLMLQIEQQDRKAKRNKDGPYDGRYGPPTPKLQSSYEHLFVLLETQRDIGPMDLDFDPCYEDFDLPQGYLFQGDILYDEAE